MPEISLHFIWLICGLILMLSEILLPGGIAFFLGLGAVIVSFFLYLGVIDSILEAFTTWFIGSLALLFGLRSLTIKLLGSHVEYGNTNEDLDAHNQIVEVCETIPAESEGRIFFRGTTWLARNYHKDQDLEKGTKVRILFRENLVWLVETEDHE